MELKPGYVLTDVGTIPEDWVVASAAELTDSDAPICYGVVQVGPNVEDGVPIVAIKFLRDIGGAPLHRASPDRERAYARSRVVPGDVLVSIKGTIGRVGIVPQGFYGNISRELARLRLRKGYSGQFIAYQFSADASQARMTKAVVGTTRLEFSIANLRRFQLPVPYLVAEQESIAKALSDADSLLNALQQLLVKKRQIKQGAMQELLTGKKRLPGFGGKWSVKRVGDICDVAIGRTPSRRNGAYWGAGFVWLSIADLKKRVVSESRERITPLAAEQMLAVSAGTLLMSFKLSIGRLCFAGCDLYTNEAICSFSNLTEDAGFLYYALSRANLSLYGKQAVKGYTLNKESLKLVEVLMPTREEQTAIAVVLSDMDAEIEALEAQLEKTRAIKQGMMYELLTGRIRLV